MLEPRKFTILLIRIFKTFNCLDFPKSVPGPNYTDNWMLSSAVKKVHVSQHNLAHETFWEICTVKSF